MNLSEGKEFAGQIVLVIGEGTAGTAISEGFRRLGANVMGIPNVMNMTDAVEIARIVEDIVEKFARIDTMVHAWEHYVGTPAVSMPWAQWKEVVQINVKSKFLFSKEVGKHMLARQHGNIVLLSSIAGQVAAPGAAAYAASQGAVQQITRTLGVEWADRGVRVNGIAASLVHGSSYEERTIRNTPIGRLPNSEEIVGAAVYLGSDASRMVTGQIITVDGGYVVQ